MNQPFESNDASSDDRANDAAAGDADSAAATAQTMLDQLTSELSDAKDRALRASAEIENVRRRARRDLDEQLRYAQAPLMRDLLPVLDNVGRAIEAAEKTPDAAGLLEGFKLVARQLQDVLARHQCKPIDAAGAPFDPHLHEAILQQPSTEHPPGTVITVVQPGYQLHDRVLRPTQVIVSSAAE